MNVHLLKTNNPPICPNTPENLMMQLFNENKEIKGIYYAVIIGQLLL